MKRPGDTGRVMVKEVYSVESEVIKIDMVLWVECLCSPKIHILKP